VDRELYIPRSWTCDPDRCRAAGLDEDTVFATKPEPAARMIGRFLDAGHRVGWVAGDEVYGGNPKLRSALEERGVGYALAVACSAEVTTGAGKFRADTLAAKVPRRAWQKLSAGAGAKGHRFYDWAVIDMAEPRPGCYRLLIRRNRTTGELAYYRCWSPTLVPLATLVRVAGSRWRVEETFQAGKGLAGLDEHQLRRYTSWSRWVTLAMLAHAFLAVIRADEHTRHPSPDGLIPLTCNEIQPLFTKLVVQPVTDVAHRLARSAWRRRHQARAQASHYRRQAANQT
jgi:SRSO17 transposase